MNFQRHPQHPMSASLVTGCGKGIGLSCLSELLHSPWNDRTIGVTRSQNPTMQNLSESKDKHCDLYFQDVTDRVSASNLIENLHPSIHIKRAILNAGIRSRIALADAGPGVFENVFSVNCLSTILWTKLLIERARKYEHPLNVLVVSSIVGARGFSDLSTYATSKSALEGFVRSAAVEYAKKQIIINAISPGFVASSYAESFRKNRADLYQWTLDQTPMGRWGTCQEVAKVCAFLVSPDNTYMTGAVIPCDGGWMSK